MGTYNGQNFLAEQLQSIENQTHKNWRLVLSDDGSTDDTLTIAKEFQDKWGCDRVEIPRAYCGRTQLVDEHLKLLGRSPLFTLPNSFRNALYKALPAAA